MAIEAQSKSFAAVSVGTFTTRTSATSDALSGASNQLVSVAEPTSTQNIMGKKLCVGYTISGTYSDVAAHFGIQVSHNGTDWSSNVVTVTTDTTPNVAGTYVFLADMTDIQAPYWRFAFNTNEVSVGTSGTMNFFSSVT